MSALAPARVGWCPGALAPMASGDGVIVRVKPRGGRLSLEQAFAVARVSRMYGNGHLDLTGRANLQVRGLSVETLADATEILDGADLLDAGTSAEAVRNVVSNPLAGLGAFAIFDVGPAVGALETRLADDTNLHALPAKFSFVVDDGGSLGLADVPADIRFEAFESRTGPAFAVRLGGAEAEAAGRCAPWHIAEAAAALAGVFMRERSHDGELRRMRHLVARLGAAAVLREARLQPCFAPRRSEPAHFDQFIGTLRRGRLLPQGGKGTPALLGVAAPFGRLASDALELLTREAGESGATGLRLTPWRSILVPGLDRGAVPALMRTCAGAGFIVDPADARLRVAACTGAPGCQRGTTPVLDHAARLAARLDPSRSRSGILLHVSGCSKGCAHAGKAPLVLVADNGRYSIVVDGNASDTPILNGLGFGEAEACVKASARMEPQP